jgi:hypothetical protein
MQPEDPSTGLSLIGSGPPVPVTPGSLAGNHDRGHGAPRAPTHPWAGPSEPAARRLSTGSIEASKPLLCSHAGCGFRARYPSAVSPSSSTLLLAVQVVSFRPT